MRFGTLRVVIHAAMSAACDERGFNRFNHGFTTASLSQISLQARPAFPSDSRGVAFAPTRLLNVLIPSCARIIAMEF